MTTKFIHRRDELLSGFRNLRTDLPDVMTGFNALHRAAMADGVVSKKHKELIALAISVTGLCDGCVALHADAAMKAGASLEEVNETLGVAVMMGGGPAAVYAAEALEAAGQFHREPTFNGHT